MSGRPGLPENPWLGLTPTHTYPPSELDMGTRRAFLGWITDTMGPKHIGPSDLFPAQNDILIEDYAFLFRFVFGICEPGYKYSLWFT